MSDSTAITSGPTSGTFTGVSVRTGMGGGLASSGPTAPGTTTNYHAARLPELGDVVLAVTRVFDRTTIAPLRIELRAFTAAAPGRGALATMHADHLLNAPGAIAYARVDLLEAGDPADERRPARLQRCFVTDAAPTAACARGVAEWLRATWETELAFGSWPALRGNLDAFATPDGGAVADWARVWLKDAEHQVADSEEGAFLKVLAAAWLDPTDEDGAQS